MGYYLILGDPVYTKVPYRYKGLYRIQPFPNDKFSFDLVSLWERYVQHYEKKNQMGITVELTLNELFELAEFSKKNSNQNFEVVYFDRAKICAYPSYYYGVDVTGGGGYSLLGEGLFHVSNETCSDLEQRLYAVNRRFRPLLNQYGLFYNERDAIAFQTTLKELSVLFPGCMENEEWRMVHVFGLHN